MPCCIARVRVHWPYPWQREERWGRTPDSQHSGPWLGGGSVGCGFLYPPTLISSADELGATIHVSEQREKGSAVVLLSGDGAGDGAGAGAGAGCD